MGQLASGGACMEVEPQSSFVRPARDRRPHMPDPPPVRLVAVEDVYAMTGNGFENELDAFYVDLLKFERDDSEPPDEGIFQITYRAENCRLVLIVREPPVPREDFRPIAVEVPSLADVEREIIDRELSYERQRGLTAGQDALVLRDPAGNWVAISESRAVM